MRGNSSFRICLVVSSAIIVLGGCASEPPPGPNIMVLLADALRADHMGCYGYERETTPHIDRFAKQGVVFEKAYVQAPLTPTSVASILTARYPAVHRLVGDKDTIIGNWRHDLMLSGHLSQLGWKNGCFSANPLISPEWGFDSGFDEFHHRAWREAERVNEDVTTWIKKRIKNGERFFAYVHYMDPHDPYRPRSNTFHHGPSRIKKGNINAYDEAIREGNDSGLDQDTLDEIVSLYDAEIRQMDEEVGSLLDWLQGRGILENTVVAFVGDHGEAFLEHGWLKHSTTLYDEMVRVPLIIRTPQQERAGQRVNTPVEAIDLLPTLLKTCQIPLPDQLDGRDLFADTAPAEHAADDDGIWRDSGPHAFSMTWNSWDPRARRRFSKYSVIEGNWKLIHTPYYSMEELYDLHEDPGELVDLAATHPEVLERLRWLLNDAVSSPNKTDQFDESAAVEVSPEILEQMRAMGYIE